jgi:acyl transferase domain-containing protein/3-hydroxymyristoyl/3-hydroxydecanoyl-(acyl carrier protein) dehydratase
MQDIAIIGVSNLFPGSKTPEEFWDNLIQCKDSRTNLNSSDLGVELEEYFGNQGDLDRFYCKSGGYIRDFVFQSNDFLLSEQELKGLDDLFLWSLHTAREALQDAGVLRTDSILKRCGVVLGNLSFPTKASNTLFMPMYKQFMEHTLYEAGFPKEFKLDDFSKKADVNYSDINMFVAGLPSSIVAKALNLQGNSFSLDAACASSCYSVKLACDYLNTGKSDLMLAGSVSAADPLFINMGFSIFHAYPTDNRSAPLDASSQGLFAGEGAGFFVLKRYDDALRDHDHIHGIIKGVGLSNDGKGEFVLSPNKRGQIKAYSRAYESAKLSPDTVKFVECHATGTPKGDRVELTSMGEFFSSFNAKPVLGAVKSNVSHLLSAAGMPSMLKAILAIKNGKIPPTINITEPVKDPYFNLDNMTGDIQSWPENNDDIPKRAGVSSFGFGGSNAHVVFEEFDPKTTYSQSHTSMISKPNLEAIAITAMACHFGNCTNLQEFSALLENKSNTFSKLSSSRWKGMDQDKELLQSYGLPEGKSPIGGYVNDFEVDFFHYKIPPRKTDALIPQQLLLLKVADEAIYQAQLKPGSNVAVIVAMSLEVELHRYRGRVNLRTQILDALTRYGITLNDSEKETLVGLCKDAMHDVVSISQYTSFIGNIMATRVSALWDFSGPALTISAEENSVFQAIDVAHNLFATSDVDAIVVAAVDLCGSAENVLIRNRMHPVSIDPKSEKGWFVGEGAGAIVLKKQSQLDEKNDEGIVLIEANKMSNDYSVEGFQSLIQDNIQHVSNASPDIAYVELNASGIKNQDEIERETLKSSYHNSVMTGSVKSNIGHTFAASGMASIIKMAWCMSEGAVPGQPSNSNELCDCSDALILGENQYVAIHGLSINNSLAHLLMRRLGKSDSITRDKPKKQLIQTVQLGGDPLQENICSSPSIKAIAQKVKNSLDKRSHQLNNNNKRRLKSMSKENTNNSDLPILGAFIPRTKFKTSVSVSEFVDQKDQQSLKLIADYNQPETVIWDTEDLVEFAEGKIQNVFGEEFAPIDKFRRRVRLPTTDYLLVTRVTELDAVPNEYKASKMVTEFDIPVKAPYLSDGQIAWSVAVESGQCDLLLISYLGIDFKNKGERVYRLLDCELTFLSDIAFGGSTLRYEIYIDSFAEQGGQLLFFFHYDCFVKDTKVLEMRGGCAGFFTDKELSEGKGVVRSKKEIEDRKKVQKLELKPLIKCVKSSFSREDILALSQGGLTQCFGPDYDQGEWNPSLVLPASKFIMIDHISNVNVNGGLWGLGLVESYKLLEPDHWYFPCHFKDDQVMAGSLMSDGCGQLVMFYMLYLGLHKNMKNARFQPVKNHSQKVRCRGQVRPQSGRLHYRMEVYDVGVDPEPYIYANVEIILNGKTVVDFQRVGVYLKEQDPKHPYARKINGVNKDNGRVDKGNLHAPLMRKEIDKQAQKRKGVSPLKHFEVPFVEGMNRQPDSFPFTPYHFFEFATGKISNCFGEKFSFYDRRTPPRTPCGDLQLTTRVLSVEGERGELKSISTCIAEYEVPAEAWYFKQNTDSSVMPYSILMEIALQPNGFLSAYMGSTLISPDEDLFFRNLDGTGELLDTIDLRGKTIVNHTTLLSTTTLGSNIIQSFSFELEVDKCVFFKGTAVFGYFLEQALSHQLGLDKGETQIPWHIRNEKKCWQVDLTNTKNIFFVKKPNKPFYRIPNGQLNLIDNVAVVEQGGEWEKGYIYAMHDVKTDDWFFPFHFHEDPVMPGSLGLQAVTQAIQVYMLKNDLGSKLSNPMFTHPKTKVSWKYRGQITPENKTMSLDVHIKDIQVEDDRITVIAWANLYKDGLRIYEITDIAVSLEESKG